MQKWNLFWNEFDERNVEIITVIINYLKVIREDVISDFFLSFNDVRWAVARLTTAPHGGGWRLEIGVDVNP